MLTKIEKETLVEFKHTKIPPVFKLDNTDIILYLEHVDFDLCNMLLKNKKATNDYLQEEIKEFSRFLAQLNISNYDDETKKILSLAIKIVLMFIDSNL